MALEAAGLYHIYRQGQVETVALRGADLILSSTSWTSLMGPSGSGKSTLLHVLAGLLEPRGGSVLIDAEDLTRLPATERARRRRRRIGVVLHAATCIRCSGWPTTSRCRCGSTASLAA